MHLEKHLQQLGFQEAKHQNDHQPEGLTARLIHIGRTSIVSCNIRASCWPRLQIFSSTQGQTTSTQARGSEIGPRDRLTSQGSIIIAKSRVLRRQVSV